MEAFQPGGAKHYNMKVFYKLEYKLVPCRSSDTFESLQETAYGLFGIVDRDNCRLRGYVPALDQLTDTYSGREKSTLSELRIPNAKTFSFEFKGADEPWSTYDSTQVTVRFTAWRSGLECSEELQLEKHKVSARRDWTLE